MRRVDQYADVVHPLDELASELAHAAVVALATPRADVVLVVVRELDASNPGTEITVTLDVSSRGLLSTMFFSLVANTIGSGLPRSVDEFADSFE